VCNTQQHTEASVGILQCRNRVNQQKLSCLICTSCTVMFLMQKFRSGIVHDSQLRLIYCLQAQATSDAPLITTDQDAAANKVVDGSHTQTANGTIMHAAR
jgi:hypothetical protein